MAPPTLAVTCGFTFIVAACSLFYELLIAQCISKLAANTVIWYSVTIGTYLCSMGLGAILCSRVFKRRTTWEVLFSVELMLTLAGLAIVPAIHMAHSAYGVYYLADSGWGKWIFFGTAFATAVSVGILSGFELPLLIRAGREASSAETAVNRVLTADYMGSLAAGLLFPLVLLPHLSLVLIGCLVAAVNLLMDLFVLIKLWKNPRKLPRIAGLMTVGAATAMLTFNSGSLQQFFLQKYYYYLHADTKLSGIFKVPEGSHQVERWSSIYQKIDLVHDELSSDNPAIVEAFTTKFAEHPEFPRDRYLYLNGDFQLTSNSEEIYHEFFAHVPILMNASVPKKVLVLGGGDGLLIRELLRHEGIERILHVDLDRKLVELAKSHPIFLAMNHGALSDSRVEHVFADGLYWIRNSEEQFDAVYVDFPYAVDYNLSKLYSREFYHFLKQRLSMVGFVAIDTPGVGSLAAPGADGSQELLPENDWEIYYNTLKAAGFPTIMPYVSTLDIDDPTIYEKLLPMVEVADLPTLPAEAGDPEQVVLYMKKSLIRELLVQYMVALQQGFIFLSNRPDFERGNYQELPFKRYILTPKTYDLAFKVNFPRQEGIVSDSVNSIMRPRLPTLPLSYVRLP